MDEFPWLLVQHDVEGILCRPLDELRKHERSISHRFSCSQLAQQRAGVQVAAKINAQLTTEQARA